MSSLKALNLHRKLQGKLSITSKLPLNSKETLSFLYTPGVAAAVNYIHKKKEAVYDLTIKRDTIAVITDGSAVLGLGNVGPEAALPVMEGKCAIFKDFAGINAFPICLATQDVDAIVETVKHISPVFAGINLEDISAPRCFEIEKRLQDLGIPVMHDDQHATAIVVLAALINATKMVKRDLNRSKIVIVGCGAAGTAIIKLLAFLKIKNILAVDRHGILSANRKDLTNYKQELIRITNPENISGDLINASADADILIGVSAKGIFTKKIIRSMVENPIVFALANPDPEVDLADAKKWGVKIYASGRSDYPNQVNNALVFPGFFKGLLKNRITKITDQMKINTAYTLASLIKNPTPQKFIPSIFDKRIVPTIVTGLTHFILRANPELVEGEVRSPRDKCSILL